MDEEDRGVDEGREQSVKVFTNSANTIDRFLIIERYFFLVFFVDVFVFVFVLVVFSDVKKRVL